MADTTIQELDDRVEEAHLAFLSARHSSPRARESWLVAVADALERDTEELIALAVIESHLSEARLRGELTRTAFQLRLLGDEVRRGEPLDITIDYADPDWGMGPRPDLWRMNEPIGVVGVFGASNFPFAFSVIGGDSASALAAGCSVVHKSHDAQPRLASKTADIVIKALREAGAPDGIFSPVTGFHTGEALVEHPLVRAVAFTGSTAGGRALFDRIAARTQPIPFFGEMGSTNPVFVMPRAWQVRKDAILRGFLGSVALGVGQFCTKPGFLIVPAGARLVEMLSSVQEDFPGGEMLSPRIRDLFRESREQVRELEGVRIIVDAGSNPPGVSVFVTTAEVVLAKPEILQMEMFGPATVIVEYSDAAEILGLAEAVDGQLTVGLQAEDDDEVDDLVDVLTGQAGRVLWNEWPTGVSVTYA
ncbi:MAG TPA: aldehyde dehydrogenase family protein [Dermatophilaceae bacterium]|jgi:acyl-CoA reductase-like NAD-dependent aldehyde dehydrogenase